MGNKITRVRVRRILVSALIVTFISSDLFSNQMFAAENPQETTAQAEAGTAEAATVDPGSITVNFKGADIKTVLAYISEVAEVDIVAAPDVSGTVDLKLSNKPWKTALDIIVRNNGFAYEREGDVIRVVTIAKLKQEELKTQAFNLNYSKTREVVDAVKNILTDRGKVVFDDRTNTVLVTDIPTNLYKIGEVISRLDKVTQQVLIDVMVIETKLDDDERMGIDWNAQILATGARRPTTFPFDRYTPDNPVLAKYTPLSQTGAATSVIGLGGAVTTTDPGYFPIGKTGAGLTAANNQGFPYAGNTLALVAEQFTYGTLDFSSFYALLQLIKRRADSELVANPRILTMNNQQADIHVGLNVILPKFERNATTGKMEIIGYMAEETKIDPKTGKEATKGIKTGVTLRVTPHVNDKKEIFMDLEPSVSDDPEFRPIDPAGNVIALVINERVAKTQARIKDGETIFIGGLITESEEVETSKLPILGDIFSDVPYLGLLVSHKWTKKIKRELIFFVTVHIINPDEKVANSPVPDNGPKAIFTMTQNETKNSKLSKKKPWNKGFLNPRQ